MDQINGGHNYFVFEDKNIFIRDLGSFSDNLALCIWISGMPHIIPGYCSKSLFSFDNSSHFDSTAMQQALGAKYRDTNAHWPLSSRNMN